MTPAVASQIDAWREEIDEALAIAVSPSGHAAEQLEEAMCYAVTVGGKRLRPLLVLASCHAAGGETTQALPPAIAVELIHTYSLVHDDLPAMDDDVLRRGKPTVHAKFGEATGVLVGDALQSLAFETLCPTDAVTSIASAHVRTLARASGRGGMAGGQALDMDGDRGTAGVASVETIHAMKTGALISACFRLGAEAAGAPSLLRDELEAAGRKIGLAFQIRDDILDVTRPTEALGKTAGKDDDSDKATWPAAGGMDAACRRTAELAEHAIARLAPIGAPAAPLLHLVRMVVERTR